MDVSRTSLAGDRLNRMAEHRGIMVAQRNTGALRRHGSLRSPRILLPVCVSLLVFGIDLATPRGMFDGYLYVLAVLACVGAPAPNTPLYAAAALTIASLVGFLVSPGDVALGVTAANRIAAEILTIAAALTVRRFGYVSEQRTALEKRCGAEASAARKQRSDFFSSQSRLAHELGSISWRLQRFALAVRREERLFGEACQMRRLIDEMRQQVQQSGARLESPTVPPVLIESPERSSAAVKASGAEHLARLPPEHARLFETAMRQVLASAFAHSREVDLRIDFYSPWGVVLATMTDGRSTTPSAESAREAIAVCQRQLREIGGGVTVVPVFPHGLRVSLRVPAQQSS